MLEKSIFHRLADIFTYEKLRYQLKGITHLSLAFLQGLVFFYCVPDWIHTFWRFIIPRGEWKNVYAFMTLFLPIVTTSIINLVYIFIYYFKHPFLEQYRVLKQPWPWERNKEEWIVWRNRLIKYSLFNALVINSSIVFLQYNLGVDHYNYNIDNLPNKFQSLWQIGFLMICDDFFFYFSHRLFHWKPLYKFHKIHHEHNVSTSFSYMYTHPVDYIFSNVLSVVSGFLILGYRCHYTTYCLWTIWRILETTDGHGGYEFPWSMFRLLPFSGSTEYHNFHHSKNSGNYSSFFTFWDSLLGTNKEFLKYKEKQDKLKLVDNRDNRIIKQIF